MRRFVRIWTRLVRHRSARAFSVMRLARATICFDRRPRFPDGAAQSFDRWLLRWRTELTHLSDCKAGGSSFEVYDIKGPIEAINAVPPQICAQSEWTNPP